jgi:ATP-dependent exoDNAse (exonuclease V) beta subunit
VLSEKPSDEFTRMYYVACSRAKQELYIHLKNRADVSALTTAIETYNKEHSEGSIAYELLEG